MKARGMKEFQIRIVHFIPIPNSRMRNKYERTVTVVTAGDLNKAIIEAITSFPTDDDSVIVLIEAKEIILNRS